MFRYVTTTLLMTLAMAVGHADDEKNRGGDDDGNRGQLVSECNHRANARELNGQDRQDFVDRCVARLDSSDHDRANRYSDCKAIASDRGLRDDARHDFIERCLDHADGIRGD